MNASGFVYRATEDVLAKYFSPSTEGGSPFIFAMLHAWCHPRALAPASGPLRTRLVETMKTLGRPCLQPPGYDRFFCTSAVTYLLAMMYRPELNGWFETISSLRPEFSLFHTWLVYDDPYDLKEGEDSLNGLCPLTCEELKLLAAPTGWAAWLIASLMRSGTLRCTRGKDRAADR